MATTIQISNETKKLIGTFGSKEDTYEDIIKRLIRSGRKGIITRIFALSEGLYT